MTRRPAHPRTARPPRRAFTLIEAALTTVIIGVGCVAMLELLGAGTRANGAGAELTTAVNLAGNVREATSGMFFADPTTPSHWGPEIDETDVSAYDDIDDFDGWSSAPGYPIDARRQRLGAAYDGWAQSVKVDSIRPDTLTATMSHLTLAPAQRPLSRVTVTVTRHGRVVYAQSWLAAYADPSAP